MQMPLRGIRVLDLSRVRAGPTCVRVLADFGAEVVKIEPPPGLDANDSMFADDRFSGDFQNLNRNKESLTLNLKEPLAREAFFQMVGQADVVVENWRPDVKARLGLDYDSLARINPRIILASISGFGQDGPYASKPGFDQVIQGMTGLMSVTGVAGQGPVRAGIAVADTGAGLYAAMGILLAVIERQASGKGQWVHVSLLQTLIAMMDFQMVRFLNEGEVPQQEGNDHPTCSPMGLFRSADGYFNIGVAGEGNWRRFCEFLERLEWQRDERFNTAQLRVKNRAELNAQINQVFTTRPTTHWIEGLNRIGIPAGPVYTVPQVFEDAQVRHQRVAEEVRDAEGRSRVLLKQPIQLSRTPAELRTLAPAPGQHNDEVLKRFGFSSAQIRQLQEARAI